MSQHKLYLLLNIYRTGKFVAALESRAPFALAPFAQVVASAIRNRQNGEGDGFDMTDKAIKETTNTAHTIFMVELDSYDVESRGTSTE